MNINDTVGVKLKPSGITIYVNWFLKIDVNIVTTVHFQDGNYAEMELWRLMQIFGPHISASSEPYFVDNEITLVRSFK